MDDVIDEQMAEKGLYPWNTELLKGLNKCKQQQMIAFYWFLFLEERFICLFMELQREGGRER